MTSAYSPQATVPDGPLLRLQICQIGIGAACVKQFDESGGSLRSYSGYKKTELQESSAFRNVGGCLR